MKKVSGYKALGIGMAIGGAALAVGSAMMSKSAGKAAKKNMTKAMKAVGGLIDNVQYMMK